MSSKQYSARFLKGSSKVGLVHSGQSSLVNGRDVTKNLVDVFGGYFILVVSLFGSGKGQVARGGGFTSS